MEIRKTGLWPWLLQRLSGAFLAVGLAVHLWVNPLAREPIAFSHVAGRLQYAGWFLFDLLLLAACLYHGLNGLWAILLDFNPGVSRRRAAGWLLALVGTGWLVYGTLTLIAFSLGG